MLKYIVTLSIFYFALGTVVFSQTDSTLTEWDIRISRIVEATSSDSYTEFSPIDTLPFNEPPVDSICIDTVYITLEVPCGASTQFEPTPPPLFNNNMTNGYKCLLVMFVLLVIILHFTNRK